MNIIIEDWKALVIALIWTIVCYLWGIFIGYKNAKYYLKPIHNLGNKKIPES